MPSFAKALAACALLSLLGGAAEAQDSHAAELYKQATAREATMRQDLDAARPGAEQAEVLRHIRALSSAYEDMSRLFPASGYSDNALWQGAMLSADAFWQFGFATDRATALRMLQALTTRFPTSSLIGKAPPLVKRLEAARPTASATVAAVAVPRAAPPLVARAPSSIALLKSVRREVLGDAVRVTLELEREAAFRDLRPAVADDGAPRLFIDLLQTRPVEGLGDTTLAFPDDVVRQVRVIRQQATTTRVALDLQTAARYSVYALYSPFRVVIDFERAPATARPRAVPPPSLPAPVRPPPAPAPKNTRIAAAPAPALPPALPPAPRPASPSASPARPRAAAVLNPLPSRQVAAGWVTFPPVAARTAVVLPAEAAAIAAAAKARTSTKAAGAKPVIDAAAAVPPVVSVAPTVPSANASGGFSLSRQLGLGVARIVIDAGHGGRDPGAKGRGINEADLVLDVALRLEKLLARQPGVEVVLTRRGDTFVPLEERTAIANRSAADLFLSIHANASANRAARGVETYFLNFAPNTEAEAIAARENAGSAGTMRQLPDIVRAIALNNKIDESRDFATAVQGALYDRLRKANRDLKNLGVKQAPFMVLIGATMPSVLAEISFLTNGEEGTLLRTDKYRQQIAEALLAGIMRYQQSLKRVPAVAGW